MKKYIKQLASSPMRPVLIGGTVLLVLFTQCALFGRRIWSNVPPDEYCKTVGTIVDRDFSVKNRAFPIFEYYVGNIKHQGISTEDLTWAPYGEKYLMIYDSLYPENQKYVHLITDCPVFLPGEVTNYTVGKILDQYIRKHLVTFELEYTVLGKTYQRIQFVEEIDPLINYPKLVNGAEFLVEYWVENPQRAILYTDKPKRDGMPFSVSPDINVLRPNWYSIPVVLPDPELTKGRSGW
jgi:hypothetical protein